MATLGYALSLHEGKSYEELLKETVLAPLNLKDTTITLSTNQQARFAAGYDLALKDTPRWDRKVLFGNGALRSTARDMTVYAQALLHPDATPFPESIKRVLTPAYTSATQTIGYGWFILPSGSAWHNGKTGGFTSNLKIYPSRDLAIFYLTNTAREFNCFIEAAENLPCTPNP